MVELRSSNLTCHTWFWAVILLCIFIASGCAHRKEPTIATHPWFASLKDNVVTTVEDKDRARELVFLINELEQVVMETSAVAESYREQLVALNADYDATREEFFDLREKMHSNNVAAVEEIGALRGKMKSQLTEDEWEKIMRKQNSLFETAVYQ